MARKVRRFPFAFLFSATSTLALAACPKDTPQKPSDAGAATTAAPLSSPSTTTTSAPDAGKSRPKSDAGPSRAEVATLLKLLTSGRKKAQAKDWSGAIDDFNRALEIAPDDARLLSELGWAAFNAGDLARARAANERALVTAKDSSLRAQVLYNEGRVAEAVPDKVTARKAYEASLALRDNAEVVRRLTALGVTGESAGPCAEGAASIDALCACFAASAEPPLLEDWKPICAPLAAPKDVGAPSLFVLRRGAAASESEPTMGELSYVLATKEGGRARPLADLGSDYEPGAFGVHDEATIVGGESRTIGARKVVVVKSEQRNSKRVMAGLEDCFESIDREAVCAIGSGTTPTRCVLVPVLLETGCTGDADVNPADIDESVRATFEEMRKHWGKTTTKLAWTLQEDGKLAVKKVSGDGTLIPGRVLGVHDLF